MAAAAGERFAPASASACRGSGWTCGVCRYCRSGRENLCDRAGFTGYTRDGGYAELAVADERFCFPLPDGYRDVEAAPLLCAGLIGYRTLRMAGDAERLGLYGFGAAAHIVCQVARHQGRARLRLHARRRRAAQAFARELGAVGRRRVGPPPEQLDAAMIFAPVGELVPAALRPWRKGGTVVCGGIHMSDIPSFPYGCCGRSGSCARWPTSRAPTARSSWRWRRGCRCAPRWRRTRWQRRARRWSG